MASNRMFRLVVSFLVSANLLFCGVSAAICVGCGGSIGGNMPCYTVGEIIVSNSCWNQSAGVQICIKRTYVGNCEVRDDWFRNGSFFRSSTFPGGCNCLGQVPKYDLELYPVFDIHMDGEDPDEVTFTTDQAIESVQALSLETGEVLWAETVPLPAGSQFALPSEVFEAGVDYLVLGLLGTGRAAGFLALSNSGQAGLSELQIFNAWGSEEEIDRAVDCTIYNGVDGNQVTFFLQRSDNSFLVEGGDRSGDLLFSDGFESGDTSMWSG